jgi:hypothetical protein
MGIRIIKEIQNMKIEAIKNDYLQAPALIESKICQRLLSMSMDPITA